MFDPQLTTFQLYVFSDGGICHGSVVHTSEGWVLDTADVPHTFERGRFLSETTANEISEMLARLNAPMELEEFEEFEEEFPLTGDPEARFVLADGRDYDRLLDALREAMR